MARIRAFLGYLVAAAAVPVLMAGFVGMNFWSRSLVAVTGMTVSPWFTGGEESRTIAHEGYRTVVHRPVFDALIGERRRGFVQVDWTPLASLPARIDEEIDYDGDGRADFRLALDTRTGETALETGDPLVLGLQGSYKLKEAWAVRVGLRNE